MNEQEPSQVMTVPEVAAYLKLARSKVSKLAQSGELPGRKVGGKWRFARRLEEWLQNDSKWKQSYTSDS